MGTFYALGVIKNFEARSERPLTEKEWKEILTERVDLEIFDTKINNMHVEALLQAKVFSESISDFYNQLRDILAPRINENIDYYQKEYGQEIQDYEMGYTRLYLQDQQGARVTLDMKFVMLFIEGKVIAEEFYTEPSLINWLFRHSKMQNKLAGCIVSGIVG